MVHDYAILRDTNMSSTAEPFAGARAFASGVGTPPEPKIEIESLNPVGVRDIAREPEVVSIAPLMPTKLVKAMEVPAQAAATSAWGLQVVGATASSFSGAGVTVAVLDTGIDAAHPAFQGVTLVEKDFTGSGNGDAHGHGSHCAGTIFGRDVGGTRIGIARGVTRALIGKVLDANGGGSSDMIFQAIQWAAQEGAHVVSMSLGFDFPGMVKQMEGKGVPTELATSFALEAYRGNLRMFDALMDMIRAREAFEHGAVIVAAAGNESRRDLNPNYEIAASLPAAAEHVISVGALGQGAVPGSGLVLADFSNTFPQICGPGINVLSARKGGGLVAWSGTSMACPHVAGVAALWWEAAKKHGLPQKASAVAARVLGRASTAPIAATVDVADRGVGLAIAP